jgi:hypothetical protein
MAELDPLFLNKENNKIFSNRQLIEKYGFRNISFVFSCCRIDLISSIYLIQWMKGSVDLIQQEIDQKQYLTLSFTYFLFLNYLE